MFVLLTTYFYTQSKGKPMEKAGEFVAFIRKNFDHKKIDMDRDELQSAINMQLRRLNKKYERCSEYGMRMIDAPGESKVVSVTITRSGRGLLIGSLRFLHLDPAKDSITPLEVEYTEVPIDS